MDANFRIATLEPQLVLVWANAGFYMRRVVITGLGLVTPLGCGVEATWSGLLAGKSGARRVAEFEVGDLPCQIGCFIPRGDGSNGTFNPDQWMEPKEQRKVDDFIVYAMAAADQALADSGYKATTKDQQERTGASDNSRCPPATLPSGPHEASMAKELTVGKPTRPHADRSGASADASERRK